MPDDESSVLKADKPGTWRHEILDRVGRLRAQAVLLKIKHSSIDTAVVMHHLKQAEEIVKDQRSWAFPARHIENCWRHLRLAEERLIALIPDTDAALVAGAGARASAHAKHLGDENLFSKALAEAIKSGDNAKILEAARDVTVESHSQATVQHMRQRAFRNQLRWLAVILALLAAGLMAGLFAFPMESPGSLLPLPAELTSAGAAVSAALAFGSLGALFSAIPSLAHLPSRSDTPFNPVKEQAALKVVVGAWSALVGLVVVKAGVSGVSGPEGADAGTLAGFAVMAAYFGASQEALTRFADRKAGEVAPSED